MILTRMLKGIVLASLAIIVALAVIATLTVGFLSFGVPFAFAVVLITVTAFAVYLIRKYTGGPERGKTVIRIEPDEPLYWHNCRFCTEGTQMRSNRGWGPIPEHLRITRKGIRMFQPPQGNVRTCTHCCGRGGYLLPHRPKAS